MPTNAEILALAPTASYLAANDVRKGGLFNNFARLNPILPQQIYAVYFSTKKIYDIDPNYSGMTAVCLYLWELMGRYGIAAQGITGGGSVAPITPISSVTPYDFIVTLISSPFSAGATQAYLGDSWKGRNIIFSRGGQLQSITTPDFGTYYLWDSPNAVLYLLAVAPSDPAAMATERFQIYPTI